MASDNFFVVKNGLQAEKINLVSPDKANTISISMLDSDTLSFSGNSGQLFSITDTMEGTIFAVNDISGVPSIEVDDDGTIRFAETFGNVLIGTAVDNGTSKLQVNGNIATTSLTATGNVTAASFTVGADSLAEYIADTVGAMVTSNTESGIAVTYDDADNTLDFDVADFTITLAGDLSGSVTITNLANGTLTATIGANSVALGTDTTGNYIATIAGTTNQVSVSGSGSETAAVTLSLPQDIHSGASPNFSSMTLSGDLTVQGGDIIASGTTFNLINTTATTVSFAGAATTLGIGATTGTTTINNNLVVSGNLTISGTTTTINTETINLADNIIVLNSNYTGGTPTENAGIEIERGTLSNVVLQWNETADYWEIASGGTTGRILTTGDEGTGNGLDADTVDGIQGASLLRSDASDNYTSGTLTFNSGTSLTAASGATVNFNNTTGTAPFVVTSTTAVTNLNSDLLDGQHGSYYQRRVVTSSTAPSTPTDGDLWWDDEIGKLFIYYEDGTSNQWVEASPSGSIFDYDSVTDTYTLPGNLTVLGDVNSTSDETLKENIETTQNALEKTLALRGVNFNWKESGKPSIGLIAQEVEKILPELVATDNNGIKSVQYGNIVAILIEAIKEQNDEIQQLKEVLKGIANGNN